MTLIKESLPAFENVKWSHFLNLYSKNSILNSLLVLEIRIHFDDVKNLADKFEFLVAVNVSVEHSFVAFELRE